MLKKHSELLDSHPYEVPCKGLFIALIQYSTILEGTVKSIFKDQTSFWNLTTYELVHLRSIKVNFGGEDLESEMKITLANLRSA